MSGLQLFALHESGRFGEGFHGASQGRTQELFLWRKTSLFHSIFEFNFEKAYGKPFLNILNRDDAMPIMLEVFGLRFSQLL